MAVYASCTGVVDSKEDSYLLLLAPSGVSYDIMCSNSFSDLRLRMNIDISWKFGWCTVVLAMYFVVIWEE